MNLSSAVLSAYGAHFSQRDVGLLLGLSPGAVRRVLRRYHFPMMHSPDSAPDPRKALIRERTPDDHFYVGMLRAAPCELCGAPAPQVDHIDPLALGGVDHHDNFAGLCAHCNNRKRATPLLISLLA